MTIEKRPSGSWRVRKQVDGKMYSITLDHKPTSTEAEKLIMRKYMAHKAEAEKNTICSETFQEGAERVLRDKANILSPSTLRDYSGRLERLSEHFVNLPLYDITQQDVQIEINRLAAQFSGKTVSNYHGFISSVFTYLRPDFHLSTKLPPKEKKLVYVPNTDDVRAIIEASRGTQFELPILLGCLGMRRGEICALTEDDIDGNKIHINKDMVQGPDEKWVVKSTPKTSASNRTIVVPDYVVALIREKGLFQMHPGYITAWMLETERRLGMKTFSLHKLRHYFASASHENGMTDAEIMQFGGWATDNVMKRVYRHALEDKSASISSTILGQVL